MRLPGNQGLGTGGAGPWRVFHGEREVEVRFSSGVFVLPAALLLLAFLFAACAADATPTAEVSVDARAVLRKSMERVRVLKSGSFSLEHEAGSTVLIPGVKMNAVHGVVEMPDRFRFTVETEVSGFYAETDIVAVADQAYMTDLFGVWKPVSKELLPFNFTNLGQTLVDIMEAVRSPTVVGPGQLDKVEVYRIRGEIDSEDLVTLVPSAAEGFPVELELWVEQTEGMLLKVRIIGQVVGSDIPEVVRVLTLSDIDEPVEISLPE